MTTQILKVNKIGYFTFVSLQLSKNENFDMQLITTELENNPSKLINYIDKLKLNKRITEKNRIDILNEIQKNPIFSIVKIENNKVIRIR